MLFFRTDANSQIASGHIMRCMTIAGEILKNGEDVVFIISEDKAADILKDKFLFYLIDKKNEFEEINRLIRENNCTKIFIDLYSYDAEKMKLLPSDIHIITFDDMFLEKYPVDMLINYNMYYQKFNYKERYNDENVRLLLGPKYIPIRDEFDGKYGDKQSAKQNVMLVCGGGDIEHSLLSLIGICEDNKYINSCVFHIVVGNLSSDYMKIKHISNRYENIFVYKSMDNIASFMENMNIVISAASTMLYECCIMKIPTIYFCVADNQLYDAECFSKDRMMLYAGDIRKKRKVVVDTVKEQLDMLLIDEHLRAEMKSKMSGLIDNKGKERIALEILRL